MKVSRKSRQPRHLFLVGVASFLLCYACVMFLKENLMYIFFIRELHLRYISVDI